MLAVLKTDALILLTSSYEGGVGAADELVYGNHIFPTYGCTLLFVCLAVINTKTAAAKWQKKRATAVVVYAVCEQRRPADCSTERWV